jgi:putative endopeptidase
MLASLLFFGSHAVLDAAPKAGAKKPKGVPVVIVSTPPTCMDFYAQANADWLVAHPGPAQGSVSAFDAMYANARTQERALLEATAQGTGDDASGALGTLWNEGTNDAAIDLAGATPLQPLFARIALAKKNKDLAGVIADLHAAGVPVLFNFSADIDLKDFDHQLGYANQGGLGLPDPDYYTRADAETRELLGRYRTYIQVVLQQSGTPAERVSEESGWVLGIEMQLANASLPLVQLRDPNNAYRPVALAELQKAYPNLAFGNFLKAQHADDNRVSLAHTGFFAVADGMLATIPVQQWQAYLRFHVASAMAPYLSRGLQDAHYQLYDRLLGGMQQPHDRARQVMDAIDRALGPAMGHLYAGRYLSPEAKDAAERVAKGLRAAMKDAIDHNAWMDAPTRAAAQAKLDRLRIEIGEPSRNPSLSGLVVGGGFANDMLAVAAWRHHQEMDSIGKRTSERRWPVLAQVPDVSYDLVQNRVVVTAAFLQPPVFDPNASAARQFGALGSLIGHQLHYAFDGKGRTIDANGDLHDWWTPLVSAAWEQRVAPVIAQYDAYPVLSDVKVNGHQTRDENLADLGGVELAWAAFQAASPPVPTPAPPLAAKPKGAHGKATAEPMPTNAPSPQRDFFDAYAKVWARNTAPDTALAESGTSVQAPAKYRVDGVLANMPEFGKAYACKPGQPMQLASPLTIWR